jgi:ribosomal protein S3AE
MPEKKPKEKKPTEEKPKEAKAAPKEAEATKEEKPKAAPKEKVSKKWKGKDWYAILAPEMFSGKQIGEVPATDAKTLVGRNLEVSLPELVGQTQKYYIKVKLKATSLEDGKVKTRFNGMDIAKDQMFRIVRKRTRKTQLVNYIVTKDDWRMKVSTIMTLNRRTNSAVGTRVRAGVDSTLKEFASGKPAEEFMKAVFSGDLQHSLKKSFNKVYPIRFSEISKIEVMKAPKAG